MNSLRSMSISRRLWLILIVAVLMLMTLGVLMLKQIHDGPVTARPRTQPWCEPTTDVLDLLPADLETAGTLTRDAAQTAGPERRSRFCGMIR